MVSRAKKARGGERPPPVETQATVALTVVWMLTCLCTAAGLAVVILLRVLMNVFPMAGRQHPLANVAGMLLFVVIVTGLLCLVFTPLAVRMRQTRPPRSIVIGAVLIGLAPLITVATVLWGVF